MISDPRRPATIALIATGCLLLSLVCFAPRLWLMRTEVPGSFQWSRAHTYLMQCEQPWRRDIEPAMQWRLLPPLVAHGLGLRGPTAFVVPWLGALTLLVYVAILLARRLPDTRFVFGGTLLTAGTSAVLVPTGWLGINDAWVWLGLLAVSFGRARWALPAACLLCPWIDERFIIGLPLAWVARCLDENTPVWSARLFNACWLLPYIALRLALGGNPLTNPVASHFLAEQWRLILIGVPLAQLGWWMGLRVGWVAIGYAIFASTAGQRRDLALIGGGTLVVSYFLASDLSRSVAILLPALVLGVLILARREPVHAPRILLGLGCANLLVPAAHVILTHIDPISPLPVEFYRWLRLP